MKHVVRTRTSVESDDCDLVSYFPDLAEDWQICRRRHHRHCASTAEGPIGLQLL